ncbi:PCI superfamily domain-containing protein [Histoplasma capsulatum var. duboisii H88]|uniref:PCI superfamily domain-containing protein n=2 Tax=Ajellomyces capsulatus (strain H88) TaxID=544711 RepID=A0A8A1LB97_AJEC8|nr:PCI superfamily domain-containing protein [Histoplasma capsulatum var. duboisii H88]
MEILHLSTFSFLFLLDIPVYIPSSFSSIFSTSTIKFQFFFITQELSSDNFPPCTVTVVVANLPPSSTMEDTPRESSVEGQLSPDDFNTEEMALRDELDGKLRAAVDVYSEAPYGSFDCLTFRLREVNIKLALSQLDWRVLSRKYKNTNENDPAYSDLIRHYYLEQDLFVSERERLGRELWHLYQKSVKHEAHSERGRSMRKQNDNATELFMLLGELTLEEEERFLADMERTYGLAEAGGEVWSPITGWAKKADVSAAQIFPRQIGQEKLATIFGDAFDGNIHGAENGLFLPAALKSAFEDYKVAIIQDVIEAHPCEYKFVVLDPNILNLRVKVEMTFDELNGRRLIFRPGCDFRPNWRFLHFHYAVAMRLALQKSGSSRELSQGVLSELGGVWKDPTMVINAELLDGFVRALEAYREI